MWVGLPVNGMGAVGLIQQTPKEARALQAQGGTTPAQHSGRHRQTLQPILATKMSLSELTHAAKVKTLGSSSVTSLHPGYGTRLSPPCWIAAAASPAMQGREEISQ